MLWNLTPKKWGLCSEWSVRRKIKIFRYFLKVICSNFFKRWVIVGFESPRAVVYGILLWCSGKPIEKWSKNVTHFSRTFCRRVHTPYACIWDSCRIRQGPHNARTICCCFGRFVVFWPWNLPVPSSIVAFPRLFVSLWAGPLRLAPLELLRHGHWCKIRRISGSISACTGDCFCIRLVGPNRSIACRYPHI